MNVLLFEDLFLSICLHLTTKQIIRLELLSKDHSILIRKTVWDHDYFIIDCPSLFKKIKKYPFKKIYICTGFDINKKINYLINCHTLDLSFTNITEENIKLLNCKVLYLHETEVTDECIQDLRLKGCIVYN